MTRNETLELWRRCEMARAAAKARGVDDNGSHAAAKAVWDGWAASLLARRLVLETTGAWKIKHDALSGEEPDGPETSLWFGEAAVDFINHTFEDDADFRAFVFPGEAFFGLMPLPAGNWQRGAEFGKNARFNGAQFGRAAHFGGVKFSGYAGFRKAQFLRDAKFQGAQFEGEAYFDGAIFERSTEFIETKFLAIATFDEADFQGDVRFRSTEFRREARFNQVMFRTYVGFGSVQFRGNAQFSRAKFDGNAGFRDAVFQQAANFQAVRALRAFSLVAARFGAVPNFVQAHFEEAPDLDSTRIHIPRADSGGFWHSMGWRGTSKGNPDVAARFRALKRLAIQAHDSDLEHDFSAGELKGRRGVQDFAFPSVGRLRRGEPVWPGALRYWLGGIYGLFSDYGRSITRPLFWWLVLTAIFWGLYLSVHIADHDRLVASALAKVEQARSVNAGRLPDNFPIEILAVSEQPPYGVTPAQWSGRLVLWLAYGTFAHAPPPPSLHCMGAGGYRHPEWDALTLAVRKGFLFLGLDQAEVLTQINACLYGAEIASTAGRVGGELVPVLPYWVGFYSLIQTLISAVLIFLFLLAVRNMFKIK